MFEAITAVARRRRFTSAHRDLSKERFAARFDEQACDSQGVMANMTNAVAVVTGGSRGIGLPVARAGAEEQLLN
jgi:hypothetical protein